jgi:hypothetical protein
MKTKLNVSALPVIFIFISLLIGRYQAGAQTEISAGTVNGVWLLVNSPYHVNGEVTIPDGDTLVIEPGVQVIFTGYYKLNVQGQLLAIGNPEDTIVFTAQDHESGWNGLRFIHTPATNDTSKIIYCRLQYGFTSAARDSLGGAMLVKGFNKLVISNCLITLNKTSGDLFTGGGGIGIEFCSPIIKNNTICFNTAEGGHGGGMFVWGGSPIISNNIIGHNQATGGGAFATYQCNPVLINNTIADNSAEHGGGIDCIMTSPKLINTILYGNTSTIGSQVHCSSPSEPGFYSCDVEGGISAFARDHSPGGSFNGTFENTIESEPLFVAASAGDYHLMDGSPCISKGKDSVMIGSVWYVAPEVDLNGNPRPNPANTTPDIGALENPTGHLNVDGLEELLHPGEPLLMLHQNYPNPFNSITKITFEVEEPLFVNLRMLDFQGRTIQVLVNDVKQPGEYSVTFDAKELESGIYLYRLLTGDIQLTRKCQLLK